MEVIPATLLDLDNLAKAYAHYFCDKGECWPKAIAYKRLHQIFTMEDSLFLKAVDNGINLGILMGFYDWYNDGPMLYIVEVLVFKGLQGKGIGTALMEKAEECAKAFGANSIALHTLKDAQHEGFYGKLNYTTRDNIAFKIKKI